MPKKVHTSSKTRSRSGVTSRLDLSQGAFNANCWCLSKIAHEFRYPYLLTANKASVFSPNFRWGMRIPDALTDRVINTINLGGTVQSCSVFQLGVQRLTHLFSSLLFR